MILVVGATGLLGGEICRLLRRNARPVRALVRPGSPRIESLRAAGAECVEGDLKNPGSLREACEGMRAVITTANSILSRRQGDNIRSVDLQGHLDLIAAARAGGVAHFVYTSVSPNLSSRTPFIRAKRRVEETVRASGMEWTILQPSAFMEIAFSKIAGWDLERGTAIIVNPGTKPASFVSYRNVAEVAVLSLETPALRCRDLPLGGPEPLSPEGAVILFERLLGIPFKTRRIPNAVLRIMSSLLRPIDPVRSSLIGMVAETSARGDVLDGIAALPGQLARRISLEDYIRETILTTPGALRVVSEKSNRL